MDVTAVAVVVGVVLVLLVAWAVWSGRVISDPAHYERMLGRANQARVLGKVDDARRTFNSALRGIGRVRAPAPELVAVRGRVLMALGEMEFATGRRDEAVAAYRVARGLVEVPTEIHRLIARVCAEKADLADDARDAYIRYLTDRQHRTVAPAAAEDVELGLVRAADAPSVVVEDDPVIVFLRSSCTLSTTAPGPEIEAVAALAERIIQADAELPWAWIARGLSLDRLGRAAEAVEAFTATESLVPNDPFPPYRLGLLYIELKRPADAERALRRTLAIEPEQVNASFHLATMLAERVTTGDDGDLERAAEAEALTRTVIRLEPAKSAAHYLAGRMTLVRSDLPVARADFAEAVRLDPSVVAYRWDLADVQRTLGDRDGAIEQLRAIVRLRPEHAAAHRILANLAFEDGLFADAEHHFSRVLANEPADTQAQIGLGRSLYERGSLADAISVLERAPHLDRPARFALARALGRSGLTARAVAAYEDCIRLDGSDSQVLFYLGCARATLGDLEAACTALAAAGRNDQGPPEAMLYLARALLARGRLDDVAGALSAAARRLPNDPLIATTYGELALRQGNPAAAAAAYDVALGHNQDVPAALVGRGIAAETLGDDDRAIDLYRRAEAVGPSPVTRARLGLALARTGAWAEAATVLADAEYRMNVDVLPMLGLARAMLGDPAGALEIWESSPSATLGETTGVRNQARAAYLVGMEAFARGDFRPAIDAWVTAAQLLPDAVAVRESLQESYVRIGAQSLFGAASPETHQAVGRQALTYAMQIDREDPRPRRYLAADALANGAPERAIELLAPLVATAPDDDQALLLLAQAHLCRGEPAQAGPILEQLAATGQVRPALLDRLRAHAAALDARWDDALDLAVAALDARAHGSAARSNPEAAARASIEAAARTA